MKNRSNIREPAAHSSIMSGKQLLQAHKCTLRSACVCVCVCDCIFVYVPMHVHVYVYLCL